MKDREDEEDEGSGGDNKGFEYTPNTSPNSSPKTVKKDN